MQIRFSKTSWNSTLVHQFSSKSEVYLPVGGIRQVRTHLPAQARFEKMGYKLSSVHQVWNTLKSDFRFFSFQIRKNVEEEDKQKAVKDAGAIFVGGEDSIFEKRTLGGNTFSLLKSIYDDNQWVIHYCRLIIVGLCIIHYCHLIVLVLRQMLNKLQKVYTTTYY